MARETLSSRIGFILLSVGCAVGLGNVWRFPYITGKFGGGMFVLLYLFFLFIFGFPLLTMELAIGRCGRANLVGCYDKLSGGNKRWLIPARLVFCGNVLLMMFYTTISGWLLAYAVSYLNGSIMACSGAKGIGNFFENITSDWQLSTTYMAVSVAIAALLCSSGLRKGVESSVKVMMVMLFLLIAGLAIYAMTLRGAAAGLRFYLMPDVKAFSQNFGQTLFAALGQAFFTLSIGIGSMAIFGSYIGRERKLAGESVTIILLDTTIALLAGFIIFPVCASFNVSPAEGSNLVFVSIPHVFNSIAGGRIWGALFFIFMSLAALTTVVAVFENIIAFLIDEFKLSRPKAAAAVGTGIFILSLPCVFGFNLWKSFQPFGPKSSVLDVEDFIISQNLLPLGALLLVIFCFKCWGWKNFIKECNTGNGFNFPEWTRFYCKYILPLLLTIIFALGYREFFIKLFAAFDL